MYIYIETLFETKCIAIVLTRISRMSILHRCFTLNTKTFEKNETAVEARAMMGLTMVGIDDVLSVF